MTAEQKRRTITRWLLAGLPYKTWTIRETTWVLYEELIQALFDTGQFDALRSFLRAVGDKDREAAMDREIMGQGHALEVQDTPALRGR